MAGYTRQDVSNDIATGNVIDAADLDAEFDQMQTAMDQTTGHTHDGSTGEGAPITVVGPNQEITVSVSGVTPSTNNTIDLGTTALRFKDAYFSGDLTVGGSISLGGTVTFSDTVTISSGGLIVSAGGASITGNSSVSGSFSCNALTASSGSFGGGSLSNVHDVNMNGDINGAGDVDCDTITCSGAASINGNINNANTVNCTGISCSGNAYINGNLTGVNSAVISTLTATSTATFNSNVNVQSDLSVDGGFSVSVSGPEHFTVSSSVDGVRVRYDHGDDQFDLLCELDMYNNVIGRVADPPGNLAAANKQYVDSQTSDPRLKKNIEPYVDGLELIKKVNPYSFEYQTVLEEGKRLGVLSTEVKDILPESIRKKVNQKVILEDGTIKEYDEVDGVDYSTFIAPLINAVKQLSERVEELEERLKDNGL